MKHLAIAASKCTVLLHDVAKLDMDMLKGHTLCDRSKKRSGR